MEKYKVLYANKSVLVNGLDNAKEYAKNKSIVNFRASIFKDNKKIVTYEKGEAKSLA